MLDIKFVRENSALVKKNIERRKDKSKSDLVDELLEKDKFWRKLKAETDNLRAERNAVSKNINETKKVGGDIKPLLEKAKNIPQEIKLAEEKMEKMENDVKSILMRLPNTIHDSVPYGKDEEDNKVVKEFGNKPKIKNPKNHTELIEGLGAELERAAKIAGSRFYFLHGDLALLENALQSFAIEFMTKKGYILTLPPHMLNRKAYEGVIDLADFEDVIYKIENEDLYLIATSEHPLTAQFQGEVLDRGSLPIKLVGISPCYRKETGSHGKEEKGIWRVHQFNKIEQIIICNPEDSWDFLEELVKNASEFFEKLELHFRQTLICTGDLGIVAAKKYDLDAWIPSVKEYKEIVSASNCTSYQAVRLNIRYRTKNEIEYVHTLNSTCVATSRALVAIIEQYQNRDGSITVPKVLQKYIGKKKIEPLA